MATHIVVPLANDVTSDWSTVGPNFKKRACRALYHAWNLKSRGVGEVWLAQGAGTDNKHTGCKTLAQLGAEQLTRYRSELPIFINTEQEDVWGTLQEMLWVYEEAIRRFDEPILYFVSQPRHLWRCRLIRHWFLPPEAIVHFVESGYSKQVPRWHEVLAYFKLAAVKLGLGRPAEWLRRATAHLMPW